MDETFDAWRHAKYADQARTNRPAGDVGDRVHDPGLRCQAAGRLPGRRRAPESRGGVASAGRAGAPAASRARKRRRVMATDPVRRYLEHARRFGIGGVIEAAATELDERQLERLRGQLLDKLGIRVKLPSNPPSDKGKSVTKGGDATNGSRAAETVTAARRCSVCGRGLGGRHSHAKTCSPRCRKQLQRQGGK
jgi:hypothetical protein